MNDAKFARAGNIYLRAIQVPAEQREQFLADECEDSECRELVDSMLIADAESIALRGGSSEDSKSIADAFEETFIQPVETIQRIADEVSMETPAALGRYEIKGVLGQGAFGRVYLGRDSQLDRDVAIKLPRGSMKKQEFVSFLQEARRVAQLRHPGIVAVFDVGEFEDRIFIVSDFISGTTLTKWIQQTNYTWQRAAAIVADIADALGHAHSQGIMHRDVKPANVMMTVSGKPVLLDFGLALSTAEGGEAPGLVAGTPQYMSPEQALGQAHRVDGRTDLYALGVVFYQMLSGQMPFAARSTHELLRRITEDSPQPLREIDAQLPPEVEFICQKAMAREMADRHSTMADFAKELRDAIAASPEAESAVPASGEEPTVDFAPQPGGASLQSMAQPGEGSSIRSDSRIHDSERRQVTALYCDIDDGGADLDPEELHAIVTAVQNIAIRLGEEFGGHVGRQSVEGLLIYFGYPTSFEDAVFRAVRAGRDLLSDAEPVFRKLDLPDHERPSLRVGIHTGLVVAEESREPDGSVSGTVNIVGNVSRVATGLAVHAEANGLVISETVQRIAGGSFDCQSLGAHRIKGLRRDVELFKVVAERDVLASSPNLSPLIGREHELGLLAECWRQASGGNSQVVLVGSEAGVGKSRLFEAFVETLAGEQVTQLFGRGSAYHINSALWPVSQILGQLPGVSAAGESDGKLAVLESLADRFELPREDCIPFLAEQLGLSTEGRYPLFAGTPERRKQRTLESIVDVVLGLAEEEPLLFVVEDLHWIDTSTVELISALIEESSASQIMLVLTYRPSFSPPWAMQTDVSQFTLGHLDAEQTRRLAEFVAGSPIPTEVTEHIVKRTDGVPLYVEEMMKAVLEAGVLEEDRGQLVLAAPLDTLPIPETLQDSLMARLDRLGQAKDVAQIASVIGREFTYKLLREVVPFEEEPLQHELKQLVESELIFQRGRFPQAKFLFKHALVQDTAYESLLRRHRQEWHRKIAESLIEKFEETATAEPELIARHFDEAARTEEAVDWWTKAGLLAQGKSAHEAAIDHFQRALDLTEEIEDEETKLKAEFGIQTPRGVSILSTQGYAAPQVGPIFERARELSDRFGGPAERFFTLWGIWAWRIVKDQLDICCELADDAFAMEDAMADEGLRMEAHFMPGLTRFYMGHFDEGLKHCLAGVDLYDEERCVEFSRFTGQNCGVTLWCYVAMNRIFLGYPEQARQAAATAVEIARRINSSYDLVFALHHVGWVEHYWREPELVFEAASEELSLSEQYGYLFWQSEGLVCRSYGHLLLGNFDQAESDAKNGMDLMASTGSPLARYQFLTTLAEVSLRRGNSEEALERIGEAFDSAATCLNRFMIAETHRIKGEILLALPTPDPQGALTEFQTALETARTQNARLWELRSLLSLTQLWKSQGIGDDPRADLQTTHDWFTEAPDLPDLVSASTLLSE